MYHLSWEPGFTPLIYPPFDRTHRKTRHLHLDLLTFCPKKATRGILIPWLRKLFKRRYWSGARKEIFVVDNVDARQKEHGFWQANTWLELEKTTSLLKMDVWLFATISYVQIWFIILKLPFTNGCFRSQVYSVYSVLLHPKKSETQKGSGFWRSGCGSCFVSPPPPPIFGEELSWKEWPSKKWFDLLYLLYPPWN